MIKIAHALQPLVVAAFMLIACTKKINEKDDEIYSRHLQSHVKLKIISTPMPEDKTVMNVLLINNGQDMELLNVKQAVTE